MWSKPMSLSKPLVRLRTIEPSLAESRTMSISRSLRLTVTAAIRSPDGDGAIESASAKSVFSLFGGEVAAVVGRPLLVAERLEAILQVALEVLIELVLLHLERFFVGVLAAADDALAQREQELPDAFLAALRLDELEHRVSEVVDRAAALFAVAVAFRSRSSSARCRRRRRRARSSGRAGSTGRARSPTVPR